MCICVHTHPRGCVSVHTHILYTHTSYLTFDKSRHERMCICVHTHPRECVPVYAHVLEDVYLCAHTSYRMCICIHTHPLYTHILSYIWYIKTREHVYLCTHKSERMCTCIRTYSRGCVSVYTHILAHVYLYTHTSSIHTHPIVYLPYQNTRGCVSVYTHILYTHTSRHHNGQKQIHLYILLPRIHKHILPREVTLGRSRYICIYCCRGNTITYYRETSYWTEAGVSKAYQKTRVKHLRRPMKHQKRPVKHQKRPVKHLGRPMKHQKRPTKHLYILLPRKHKHIRSPA